jgi:uncharacterized protein (TIGR02246 family)
VTIDSRTAATDFYHRIEKAWNAADGEAFGSAFAADASFVDVRGDTHDGAAAIGAGHQGIFDSIYRGSTVEYTVQTAQALNDELVLARGHSTLDVPAGPMAGSHRAVNTTVLRRTGDAWAAVAFHNTLVRA